MAFGICLGKGTACRIAFDSAVLLFFSVFLHIAPKIHGKFFFSQTESGCSSSSYYFGIYFFLSGVWIFSGLLLLFRFSLFFGCVVNFACIFSCTSSICVCDFFFRYSSSFFRTRAHVVPMQSIISRTCRMPCRLSFLPFFFAVHYSIDRHRILGARVI